MNALDKIKRIEEDKKRRAELDQRVRAELKAQKELENQGFVQVECKGCEGRGYLFFMVFPAGFSCKCPTCGGDGKDWVKKV